MAQYIDKSALVAEIERRIKEIDEIGTYLSPKGTLTNLLCYINTLEVKEVKEYKQPEYSRLETIYQCGKKTHWSIGDTLAYYEFYSDREGECVLGKITKVEFDEEQCDWFYTFEDGSVYDEQSLLENQTYKKN